MMFDYLKDFGKIELKIVLGQDLDCQETKIIVTRNGEDLGLLSNIQAVDISIDGNKILPEITLKLSKCKIIMAE